MSDKMRQIPFDRLMHWALDEYHSNGEIFGVRNFVKKPDRKKLNLFEGNLEYPIGPAAGPHTQLAQNIIAAYVTGGRFFELKTVQTLDGEDLPIAKPCILAPDECYNVEWSTELYIPQAMDEYIKAWFALALLSRELELGEKDGFIFNMSVGYDLEGIKTKKIDDFIEGLKNAEHTESWAVCKQWAMENLSRFKHVNASYIESITPKVCGSITLSTLHGCPPEEIERIASYLITEKKLNTFIKCNPTLLGYEYARKTLDDLGFDYMDFTDRHFKADLQLDDAVPMIKRLIGLAEKHSLSFGVKLTNTFPVTISAGELPGEEMYMSGRALYPLTMAVASRLSKAFDGQLRISYSGGADIHNIAPLFEAGIWPITLATTLLKPGGYQRLRQMSGLAAGCEYKPFKGVHLTKLQNLMDDIPHNPLYRKPVKPLPKRKMNRKAPLFDCYEAPCRNGCPIGQDIPAYIRLAGEGKHLEAFKIITERNPLPFITGTICSHRCTDKCTRSFYENPVDIRAVKLETAEKAYESFLREITVPVPSGCKVAVIGGGPAGLSAAYFLAKAGRPVVIFEKRDALGGIVRHVIPDFRIDGDAIDRDIAMVQAMGAAVRLNHEVTDIKELQSEGFETIIIANGAWKPGLLTLEEGKTENALQVLESMKKNPAAIQLGEHVVIVGGGNTAMDAARAAKRSKGVKTVSIVYRRTKRYMPADEEELSLAMEDGITFHELLAPLSLKDGQLNCQKMKLGTPDASGRRSPVLTDEKISIPADTVISAIGDAVDTDLLTRWGISSVDKESLKTNLPGVYVIGDAMRGPATVAEAIADAMKCVQKLTGIGFDQYTDKNINPTIKPVLDKKGTLCHASNEMSNAERCLECAAVCEVCADVCPNRANVVIQAKGRRQVLHMDALCNECGNCEVFCPYSGAPYKDKITYFSYEEDFIDSENQGFLALENGKVRIRLDGKTYECKKEETDKNIQAALDCERLRV